MKFACVIATRGRPHQAIGVIEATRLMASGEHEIEFIVACDADDATRPNIFTHNHISDCVSSGIAPPSIQVSCEPRPAGVASCWNRCLALTDADAIITLPDDGLICTADWDKCANHIFRNHIWAHPELKIGALNDLANPGQGTAFIVGRAWLDRFGLFDERFPFWFSDTALTETYSFLTGQGMPLFPINFAHKPGHWNPRLRDMKLWWSLYSATRRERLETAWKARHELNLPEPPNLSQLVASWEGRDRTGLPASEEIVRQIERPAPIDDRYLAAKTAAEVYLAAKA